MEYLTQQDLSAYKKRKKHQSTLFFLLSLSLSTSYVYVCVSLPLPLSLPDMRAHSENVTVCPEHDHAGVLTSDFQHLEL